MIALWSEGNNTPDSDAFAVSIGKAVALFAIGLEGERVKQHATEARDMQRICVSRVVYDQSIMAQNVRFATNSFCDCGYLQGQGTYLEPVEDLLRTKGCVWQLTMCDNFRLIGVPGIYRLHLNDITAIGKAQVYAEQYNLSEIAPNISSLFFG